MSIFKLYIRCILFIHIDCLLIRKLKYNFPLYVGHAVLFSFRYIFDITVRLCRENDAIFYK